jgi:hypothetical protein
VRPEGFSLWATALSQFGAHAQGRALLAAARLVFPDSPAVRRASEWLAAPSTATALPLLDEPFPLGTIATENLPSGIPCRIALRYVPAILQVLDAGTRVDALRGAMRDELLAFALGPLRPHFTFANVAVFEREQSTPTGYLLPGRDVRSGAARQILVIRDSADTRSLRRKLLDPPLAHPNLARVLDVISTGIDATERASVLVLEGAGGTDLGMWSPSSRSLDEKRRVLANIFAALEHAHAHRVVHGHLEPGSVRVESGVARIVDLGLADIDPKGRHAFIAPEAIGGQLPFATPSRDVYGVAALAFFVFEGRAPFASPQGDTTALLDAILRQAPPTCSYRDAVIRRALAKNPQERPSLADFRAALLDE